MIYPSTFTCIFDQIYLLSFNAHLYMKGLKKVGNYFEVFFINWSKCTFEIFE